MDIGWPEILIIAVVILVLFGSKKLPDAARSLGRSMRILKSEVKGMHDEDSTPAAQSSAAQSSAGQPPAQLPAAQPSAQPVSPAPVAPVVAQPAPTAGERSDPS
jgi:sec-independent protein translocase protein TatA